MGIVCVYIGHESIINLLWVKVEFREWERTDLKLIVDLLVEL